MTGALKGKVFIVTGGACGIGKGIVTRLQDAGGLVTVVDRSEASFRASGLVETGTNFVLGDATVEADIEKAIKTVVERFGRIDAMVCNVGGPATAIWPILKCEVTDFDAAMNLTVRSAFIGIRSAAKAMIATQTAGSITTIGSIAAQTAGAGPPIYSAAKAALVRLTSNAAAELAPHGIRVNCVSPGLIETENLGYAGVSTENLQQCQPLQVAGQPTDEGAAVEFLASDAARFISGANIVVDGAALAEGIGLYSKIRFGSET